ncbi:hypothetical protein AALP_AA5G163200 [Arabis alpina]|uniref:Uncharacterized protein n=1 Tax=Arabis alpina TaxID=50452 RepID=A0A087GXH0_ARAAL|nr:hypothetical protein AALP_AA5G163200 [Arabis alpina]
MTKTFESLSTSFTPERNVSLDVDHKTPPVNFDPSSFLTEIEASSSRFEPVYANTSEQTGVNLEASTAFVDTTDPDEQIGQEQVVEVDEEGGDPAVKDGSQKIPSATDAAVMQWADDALDRGSVPGESNKPKGPSDASRSKGKGKVNLVDKMAEKKWIAAKAKVDLKARRIPAFRIGGTFEVLLSEAPVAQSLGVTSSASLPVNSDSAAIPPCSVVHTAINVPQLPHPLRTELDRQKARADSWEVSANANRQSADDYAAQVEVLNGEKQRLEEEVNKRDVHVEAASAKIAELRASLEKSRLTEDCLRKKRDGVRCQSDEIVSGSSARSARHSSSLERTCSYLVALHAQEEIKVQLCYRRGARINLEKMVEDEYELPPGLLENYAKEEKEYIAKVDSFDIDSLGDDHLFPTPPPSPAGPPRDFTSQVPEGIIEHKTFLSPQDNQYGDQV